VAPTAEDRIVTLGDYIDRGADSRGVIEQLLELGDQCELIPLVGNHELMFLDAVKNLGVRAFWLECGGAETLASYGGEIEDIPGEHLEFIENCLSHYQTETHIFLHANYNPRLPAEAQPPGLAFWAHLTGKTRPHKSGKTVIVGHTPQASGKILDLGHVVCIDTCCFGGGWLTAYETSSGRVWQANEQGEVRESD